MLQQLAKTRWSKVKTFVTKGNQIVPITWTKGDFAKVQD